MLVEINIMPATDLSIVIINWNGIHVLADCLKSIFATAPTLSLEVIVVDNASNDDSVAMIARDFPSVILICNKGNFGFAAANNQAFAVAAGRYVLLLNNDTIVLEGAIARTVEYMDRHDRIGALGCRCEFPDRTFQTSCYRFTNLLELFMIRFLPLGSIFNERLNIGRYWGRQFVEPTEVDVVAGCFLAVRRDVIETIGGLDEDFFMYGEDEEWCSRIKNGGWQIVYLPSAIIIHLHRFSSKKARRALRVIECLSPVLVLHKRRGPAIAWCGNFILILGFLIRLPGWLILDVLDTARNGPRKDLIRSRFVALGAHLAGIVWPIWLPKNRTPESPSARQSNI